MKAKDIYSEDSTATQDSDFPFRSYSVYAGDDKVGSVDDVLVEQQDGTIRYFIVDTGFWVFGKKVLLPVGVARILTQENRVYVDGLNKKQVEQLPEFNDDLKIDQGYEDQVRQVYRPLVSDREMSVNTAPLDPPGMTSTPIAANPGFPRRQPASTQHYRQEPVKQPSISDREMSVNAVPLDPVGTNALSRKQPVQPQLNQQEGGSYNYSQEPGLYQARSGSEQTLKLYEDRIRTYKNRVKTGEVSVGKHIETRTEHISIPVEREQVVIERTNAGIANPMNETSTFQSGEVARIDVYEEKAEIAKETRVRESVKIRKEITQETVETDEEVRREELDINTQGDINVRRI